MAENTIVEIELDKLKACIHCGICLPTCPTYRVTGSEAESPRGRLYLMRKWIEGKLTEPEQVSPHLDQCLGCQACETACPSGVQYGQLLFTARERLAKHQPWHVRAFKRFVFKSILPRFQWLHGIGSLLRFYQRSGVQAFVRRLGILKLVPSLAQQEQLLPGLPSIRPLSGGMSFGNPEHPQVALMIGCVMDVFYNPVHWATIDVLVANDYYVRIPEQTCCGALAHHAGENDIAQELARQNILSVLRTNPSWVVLNSAGCGAAMKHYDHLLADDPAYRHRAKEFTNKVVDIMELLVQKPLKPMPYSINQTVTYHAACHLHHAQGVKVQPEAVLAQIPGITLVPLKEYDACCGSAGVYNVEHPELSAEILAMKTRYLRETQADIVATGNPGCLLQITSGLQKEGITMKVAHPIELVAQAYRGMR